MHAFHCVSDVSNPMYAFDGVRSTIRFGLGAFHYDAFLKLPFHDVCVPPSFSPMCAFHYARSKTCASRYLTHRHRHTHKQTHTRIFVFKMYRIPLARSAHINISTLNNIH